MSISSAASLLRALTPRPLTIRGGRMQQASSMANGGGAVTGGDEQKGGKAAVRKTVREALRQIPEEHMASESTSIASHLMAAPMFARSKRIGVYIHSHKLREVDTRSILQAVLSNPGAKCYVPLVDDSFSNMRMLHIDSLDGLVLSGMNILEPTESTAQGAPREDVMQMEEPLDLLLMPGLAFDRSGHRLGRGGGFYDKFLDGCQRRAAERGWPPPVTVALAYRVQVLGEVPLDDHDQPVDAIVTADGVVYARREGHL